MNTIKCKITSFAAKEKFSLPGWGPESRLADFRGSNSPSTDVEISIPDPDLAPYCKNTI